MKTTKWMSPVECKKFFSKNKFIKIHGFTFEDKVPKEKNVLVNKTFRGKRKITYSKLHMKG